MRSISQEELNNKIMLHKKWLNNESGGISLVLVGYDLTHLDLSHQDLRNSHFEDTDLKFANIKNSDLSKSTFVNVDLSAANLNSTVLNESYIENTKLIKSNLNNSSMIKVMFVDVDFFNADLGGSNLSYSNFNDVKNIETATFEDTNLSFVNIKNMISLGNVGDKQTMIYYFYNVDKVIEGYFKGTLKDFARNIRKQYGYKNKDYNTCLKVFKKYKKYSL